MPLHIEKLQIERPALRSIWSVFFFTLFFQAGAVAQVGKIEPRPALSDSAVPAAIREVLEPRGFRVVIGDANAPALEIWYRKGIPSQPKPASSDAIYDRLAESTWSAFSALINHFRTTVASPSCPALTSFATR